MLRGLPDQADLMFRVYATELHDTQPFLMDLQSGAFGEYLIGAGLAHGLINRPMYVPGFANHLKAGLKAEFHCVRRLGHLTVTGTAKSVDELIEKLAQ